MAATLYWTPRKARRVSLSGTSSDESLRSSSTIIDPTFFLTALSESGPCRHAYESQK
jgi:hypothetical protein